MIRGLGRLLLLRFLPRRIVPFLTAWEIFRLVRGRQRPRPELEATTSRRPAARRLPPR
ncbi:MAG TPA: hypothetical protein VGC90_09610 [Candidatus Limnocylindrales bacterium]